MDTSAMVSTLGGAPDGAARPASIAWAAAGYVLCALGVAAALALLLDPGAFPAGPSMLAVSGLLLAAPLAVLAMVLYSPASFEVYQRSGRFICVAVVAPFAALFFVDHFDTQLDPAWLLAPAAIASILVFIPAWLMKDRAGLSGPRAFAGVVALCGALYAYGAATYVDTRFDEAPASRSPVAVTGRWITHGRSSSFKLSLAPGGPFTHEKTISVSRRLYEATAVGDQICLLVHPGALGLAWYEARSCDMV